MNHRSAMLGAFVVSIVIVPALAQPVAGARLSIIETLAKWTPLLFWGPAGEVGGFVLNVMVSFLAMAIGTVLGLWLGLAQLSRHAFVNRFAWLITQLFRNSPWLVLLFYVMLLLPF